MERIAIVEDDVALGQELVRILGLSEYEGLLCPDFAEAAEWILHSRAVLAVIDLRLPETDGHAIVREVRSQSDIPLIVLTSSTSDFDEVMAMNLGADDYLFKPYRPAALLAHIQALLRRRNPTSGVSYLTHKDVTLDLAAACVTFNGKSADLTHNEFRILSLLMHNPGTIMSRSEIMCDLWESDAFIDDNTLTVNVNRLRRTLSELGVPEDFLVTRRGQGYMV